MFFKEFFRKKPAIYCIFDMISNLLDNDDGDRDVVVDFLEMHLS